jgi:TonB family protein
VAKPIDEVNYSLNYYLSVLYLVGCAILFIKLLANIFNLFRFIKGNETINKAFSFFNNIVIAVGIDPDDVIYSHEKVHARHFHSIDVVLFEIIGIICWFNPIIFFYKRAIKNIHEFIADEIASQKMDSKMDYAMLLFSERFQTHPSVLVNNFFTKTSLKLRIEMLNKNRSRKTAILKYGLIAPMFIGMLVFASASIAKNKLPDIFYNNSINEITGLVVFEDNEPIANASVILKGETIGTITDKYGVFKLKLPQNATIIVSHVSYEQAQFQVVDNKPILISLKKQKNQLSQIVVASYLPSKKIIENQIFRKDSLTRIENEKSLKSNNQATQEFKILEKNAEFSGGQSAMNMFLMKTLHYPKEAQNKNVQGTVFTKFDINSNGEITNIRILKSMGSGLDEEAIRVISKMPNWIPATQNGEPIAVEYNIPIQFVLEGEMLAPPPPPSAPSPVDLEFLKNTLYIVNGKEMNKKEYSEVIEAGEFISSYTMPIKEAMNKYGIKGKNGIVEVKMRNIKTPANLRFGYPGGYGEMIKFINSNLKYPSSAKRAKVEGSVEVLFTVQSSGEIKDIKVQKGIGYGCDEEAIRVIKIMPNWNPAKNNGNEVDQAVTQKIEFKLKK